MKKIAKVELRNYRSHGHSVLDFGMLTSIIGENDQGKSNVFRALDMVLLHQPFTEAHLRYGTKEGSVRVTFSDGSWIERARIGTKQTCTLSTNPNHPYETIKDVAEIVQEFTGFKPVVVDKNSKAVSVQVIPMDGGQKFFVGGTSPDGVLRRINRLMAGSGIETARITLESELRSLEKTNTRQELEVDQQQAVVDMLDSDEWTEIVVDYNSVLDDLVRTDELEERLVLLDEAKKATEFAADVISARDAFGDTLQQVYALREQLGGLEQAKHVVDVLREAKKDVFDYMDVLEQAYTREDSLNDEYHEARHQMEEIAEQERVKREQAEMVQKKVCPTCKRPL